LRANYTRGSETGAAANGDQESMTGNGQTPGDGLRSRDARLPGAVRCVLPPRFETREFLGDRFDAARVRFAFAIVRTPPRC
jgi:hypothetical protein